MKLLPSLFARILRSDAQADRVVPPSGFTAQLTLFAAGAMAFLAVFALALSLAAGRLAEQWGLLAPWFGAELQLDALPVPRLIEVIETSEGMDAAGLRLRLAAEVPGAVLDDHSRWRAPLVKEASRLRLLGLASILLIAAVTAAMVTLAANAALAANAQVISVLRLVGATDDYIAHAFIRRFTLRALIGAAVGMVLGMIAVLVLPSGGDETASFLTGLGFQGIHWLMPLLIPPLAAGVAFGATRLAARRTLEGLS